MSSSGAVSRLGTFQAFEPLERRLLLSGGAGQVAAIRWEDAAGHELADGQHVMPGAALFIAVDTVGMRGSDATVYLYEDDGPWCPDDFILPITVPVPPDGDTGRVEWRAAWHTDSDWGEEWNPIQDPAPEYRLWASQDVFEDVCTRLIELSTPALQWKTQTGQPLSADDVVEEGTFVCLSVDGLAFDAADTFTAAVWRMTGRSPTTITSPAPSS